jgi:stage II sporulation protein P
MNRSVKAPGIHVRKYAASIIIGVVGLFIIAASLSVLEGKYRFVSSSFDDWTANMSSQSLMYVMGYENHYFRQVFPEGMEPFSPSMLMFKLATNIDPEDPRSYLGTGLPGLALFDTEIVTAGEGTNITNMPIESAPPFEVLKKEREAAVKNVKQENGANESKAPSTKGKEVVFIYHSHSMESFLPHLEGVKDSNDAWHSTLNITDVGEKLGKELEKRGIGTVVNTDNITNMVRKRGWNYNDSYKMSEEVVTKAMAQNDDLNFLFDIHRDSQPRDITTVTINNKKYARPFFVVGEAHKGYEKNLKLANTLHDMLEKKYPGLSRGVFSKDKTQGNGVYNQDLSKNALIIEVGGYNNNMEELDRSAEALADAIAEYYWKNNNAKKS